MFCTKCGRELAKDGSPCVCGSGQAELILQPEQAEQEWAVDLSEPETQAVLPVETESVESESTEPAENEPEMPIEEPAAEETAPAEETVEETVEPETGWGQPEPETDPQAWVQTPEVPAQPENYIPQMAQPMYEQPGYYYPMPTYAVQADHPVYQAIRSVLASPLFLITAIVMSVNLALAIVKCFIPTDVLGIADMIISALDGLLPGIGESMTAELEDSLALLQTELATVSFGSVVGLIGPILSVTALWLIFGSAKKGNGPKTGGLVILQVLRILGVIAASIFVLIAVVGGVIVWMYLNMLLEEIAFYGIIGGEFAQVVMVALAIILGILVVYTVLHLLYTVAVLSTISRVKKALKTGLVMKKASRFVMVICFASAFVQVLDVYGTFMIMGLIPALLNLTAAATHVLFALCIIKYNKAVKPFVLK